MKTSYKSVLIVLIVLTLSSGAIAGGNARPQPLPEPAGLVYLLRFWNGYEHFYSANAKFWSETGKAGSTWNYEGVAGKCFQTPRPGIPTVPLFQFSRPGTGHYYSSATRNIPGWKFEGVTCYLPAKRQGFEIDGWNC